MTLAGFGCHFWYSVEKPSHPLAVPKVPTSHQQRIYWFIAPIEHDVLRIFQVNISLKFKTYCCIWQFWHISFSHRFWDRKNIRIITCRTPYDSVWICIKNLSARLQQPTAKGHGDRQPCLTACGNMTILWRRMRCVLLLSADCWRSKESRVDAKIDCISFHGLSATFLIFATEYICSQNCQKFRLSL